MGSNNSRLNAGAGAGGEVFPVKIRPLVHRQIEELRKRRNGANFKGETTLSKKQLLNKDAAEEDVRSQSSHDETERGYKVEKTSKVVPLPVSECRTEQNNKHRDYDQQIVVKDVDKKAEEEVKKTHKGKIARVGLENENEEDDDDNDDDDEEEEEEEDSDDADDIGRHISCPGSPSFRIYCIDAEKTKEDEEEEEGKNETIPIYLKSPRVRSVESAASATGNSNEGVEMGSSRKRKGRKKRKGLGGAMKKNLLHVKGRYHPMFTCTGNDKSRLLATANSNGL